MRPLRLARAIRLIHYEFPLNERVRTWLRLEDLFDKADYFIAAGDPRAHHAALLAIFELADVMARSDLRGELLQELDRQKSMLEPLRGNTAVDLERLEEIIEQLTRALADLHGQIGKPGQHLRENDWLMSIKNRTVIPGGACSFDLPSYHSWLYHDAAFREADLRAWIQPFRPYWQAAIMVLQLLRESGGDVACLAPKGVYQLMLSGRTVHFLRIDMDDSLICAPEVSANKYAVNLRFILIDKIQKPRTCEEDIPFSMRLCTLSGGG